MVFFLLTISVPFATIAIHDKCAARFRTEREATDLVLPGSNGGRK